MLWSSTLTMIGGAVLGGVAFAWVLPPTTPIGGPTLAEISRHVATAAYTPAVPVDPLSLEPQALPQPPIYDPGIPRVDLNAPAPAPADRVEHVSGDAYANDYGPRPYVDDYERAFRVGYRQAKRQGFVEPGDCEDYDDPARADGCRKYLDEHEPPSLDYDTPSS